MSAKVRPYLRLVANGASRGVLRATLIATPEPHGNGEFEIADWPKEMARRLAHGFSGRLSKRAGGVEIELALNGAPGQVTGAANGVTVSVVKHEKLTGKENWGAVSQLWRDAIGNAPANVWTLLCADIARSLSGQKQDTSPPEDKYPDLGAGALSAIDSDGAIKARTPKADDKIAIKGVVPIKQGAFALDEERVRASRVLTKMHRGPYFIDDEREDDTPPRHQSLLQNPKSPKDRYEEWLAQRRSDDFRRAAEDTDPDRGASRARFDATKAAATGVGKASAIGRKTATDPERSLVPSIDDVTNGKGRAASRASHVYGAWPQRSGAKEQKAPVYTAMNGLTKEETEAFERVRGVYYSLQGDPLLSRLFCFAADVEIEYGALLDDLKQPIIVRLAAEGDDEGRSTVKIVTVAKLNAERTSFWPISRFEDSAPDFVEQTAGVWRLGTGHSPENLSRHAPRYDMISLDVRRAIDGNPDAIDRGGRHLTAGVTIIDSDRSLQIARDLALATIAADKVKAQIADETKRQSVELFAEELTIGRRMDVAIACPGDPIEAMNWRSLMTRFVSYKLDAPVAAIASVLLPKMKGQAGHLDEASFQVAARSMPRIDAVGTKSEQGSERQMEAVAEEAIHLWDGTPAAALSGSKGRDGDDAPVTFSVERIYDLPRTTGDRDLCIPPLRYGAGYICAFRSMFLGGGSPSVSEARAIHVAEKGALMLPPATKVVDKGGERRVAAPQRFLRHEGISAPLLMLPIHVAKGEHGAMGFETVDSAVLRTVTKPDRLPDRLCGPEAPAPASPGPSYVAAADRAWPERTMRVFVPPRVAMDVVARHGMLDGGEPLDVLRGGLRDVAYRHAGSGFPVVEVKRAQAFNRDQAIYGRTISDTSSDGAIVFRAGQNTTPMGAIGFLPDPAVEHYVLRLRIRGSDRYLRGHLSVDVYEGAIRKAYPDVLPLAVTIEKLDRVRAAPATDLSEIIVGDPKTVSRLDHEGRLGRSGARVRHLKVVLARGEDYDLEVACAPSVERFTQLFSLPETMAMQLADGRTQSPCMDRSRRTLAELCGADVCETIELKKPEKPTYVGFGGLRTPGRDAVQLVSRMALDAIKTRWPVEEIAAVASLRVCHAVSAPLERPIWGKSGQPSDKRIEVRRPKELTTANFGDRSSWSSAPGSTIAQLTGALRLDLEQADAFEIIARGAGLSGQELDDPKRKRSLTARRSGRWPKLTSADGKRVYVLSRDVVGFHVDFDGRVTLPEEAITLLRVENLPPPGGVGRCGLPGGAINPIGGLSDRHSEIDLGLLHAAAIAGGKIELTIGTDALGDEAGLEAQLRRRRTLRSAQPAMLSGVKARKLILRVAALSRFAEAFETAPRYLDGKETLLQRRQSLKPGDQALSGEEITVWCPSTKRPAKCDPRQPTPTFVIERSAVEVGEKVSRQTLRRRALTRLYFGRGWFSSGEGERVGLVLWPPNYRDQKGLGQGRVDIGGRTMKLCDFQDGDLGPPGFFMTRWGGDPIRKDVSRQAAGDRDNASCDPQQFIPWSAFADAKALGAGPHRPGYVESARMPWRSKEEEPKGAADDTAETSPEGFLDVSLLTFEPCFDLDREEWYVDVDLRPGQSTDPFVRFGLVRYQEQSIHGDLKVSEPVSVWSQILPAREVDVVGRPVDAGLKVDVRLRGQGSCDIKTIDPRQIPDLPAGEAEKLALAFEALRRPEMRLVFTHETAKSGLTIRTHVEPENLRCAPGIVEDGQLSWSICLQISNARRKALGAGAYVVYLEEIERRMPATYGAEPISPQTMFTPATFVASGPRFSARIPFFEDVDPPDANDEAPQTQPDCEICRVQ